MAERGIEPEASRPQMPPEYGIRGPTEGRGLLSWSWAAEYLSRSHGHWIATAPREGTPHVMVVWGLWRDGGFWFATSSSTHKTLPVPQHGVVLANPKDEEMERALRRGVFPGVVSNHHLHAMAALGIALAEFETFGRAYAAQVVQNARALGQALHERGMRVLGEHLGFTASHALAVDVSREGGGAQVALDLERANIITNKNLLSGDTSPVKPSGIRLGSQELTRLGMGTSEMEEVADLIARVAVKKEKPGDVARDVAALASRFRTTQYSFHPEWEAYRRPLLV